MDVSEILNLLLSSAVIVALINVIMQNKNNKLHYVTNERSEWRKNVRKIMENIQRANEKETLEEHIISLKTYLNYYGKRYNGYQDIIVTDIEKDEHIWKLLDEIERGIGVDAKKKNQLVDFLGFLLKFDWERAKREVKNSYGIIISTVLYVLGSAVMSFLISPLKEDETAKFPWWNIGYMLPYLLAYIIVLLPYIRTKMKMLRTVNWFSNTKVFYICWTLGISLCFVFNAALFSKVIAQSMEKIWIYYLKLLMDVLSFFGVLLCILDAQDLYLNYSRQIRNCLEEKSINIYYHKDGLRTTLILLGMEGRILPYHFINSTFPA